jgi:AcrR family transcriptional regulator
MWTMKRSFSVPETQLAKIAIADLPERKAEIIDATIRVISRDGWGRATIRAIAGEIGLTTGVLWHYFSDKGDLMQAALRKAFEPWRDAVEAALEQTDSWSALVGLFLPTEGVIRSELSQVWPNVVSELRQEPELWALYRSEYGAIRDGLTKLIAQCQDQGRVDRHRDPRVESDRLCAVVDGLMMAAMGEPDLFTPAYVRSIVAYHFENLGRMLPMGGGAA